MTTHNQAWQPIETAPKDVGVLLVGPDYLSKRIDQAICELSTRYDKDNTRWQLVHVGSYAGDGDLSFKPTHWMPLPEPPTENDQAESSALAD